MKVNPHYLADVLAAQEAAVAWDCDPDAVLEDLTTPFDSEESDEWIEHSMDRWGDRLTFRCTRGW